MSDEAQTNIQIYVDADACPVKDEAVRVAERHGLIIHFVSNAWMRLLEGPLIRRVVVAEGPDAADDWIVERISARDIAVTSDIPLADRCLKRGARVVAPDGRVFTEDSIGEAMAGRELMDQLRQMGVATGGPPPFGPAERRRFVAALSRVVQK